MDGAAGGGGGGKRRFRIVRPENLPMTVVREYPKRDGGARHSS